MRSQQRTKEKTFTEMLLAQRCEFKPLELESTAARLDKWLERLEWRASTRSFMNLTSTFYK